MKEQPRIKPENKEIQIEQLASEAIQHIEKLLKRMAELESGEFSDNENVRNQTKDLMRTDLDFTKEVIEKIEKALNSNQ